MTNGSPLGKFFNVSQCIPIFESFTIIRIYIDFIFILKWPGVFYTIRRFF